MKTQFTFRNPYNGGKELTNRTISEREVLNRIKKMEYHQVLADMIGLEKHFALLSCRGYMIYKRMYLNQNYN